MIILNYQRRLEPAVAIVNDLLPTQKFRWDKMAIPFIVPRAEELAMWCVAMDVRWSIIAIVCPPERVETRSIKIPGIVPPVILNNTLRVVLLQKVLPKYPPKKRRRSQLLPALLLRQSQ